MDDNDKDVYIFALRCLTVVLCGVLGMIIPNFILGV